MKATPLDPGPLVYAHRGDSGRARDNSIEAFTLAEDAGADGIELDVRRTKDRVLVLAHDPSHPSLGPLVDRTFDEIRHTDPGIPTLTEGLAAIPPSMFVNVEIKNQRGEPDFDSSRSIVDQTLEEIGRVDDLSRILVSSFDPSAVRRSRAVEPDVLRGLLVTGTTAVWLALLWARRAEHDAVHLAERHLVKRPDEVVDRAARAGLKVVVWTVDDAEIMSDLFDAGVAAVVTNNPAIGRAIVDGR